MTDGSVDNFWLATAMRYGLPGFLFLVLAIGFGVFRIMSRQDLSAEAARYRTGHLLALFGLFVVLGTVHMWGSVSIFVMTYIGAGSWIYTGDLAPRPAPAPLPLVRERAPGGATRARLRRSRRGAVPAAGGRSPLSGGASCPGPETDAGINELFPGRIVP